MLSFSAVLGVYAICPPDVSSGSVCLHKQLLSADVPHVSSPCVPCDLLNPDRQPCRGNLLLIQGVLTVSSNANEHSDTHHSVTLNGFFLEMSFVSSNRVLG